MCFISHSISESSPINQSHHESLHVFNLLLLDCVSSCFWFWLLLFVTYHHFAGKVATARTSLSPTDHHHSTVLLSYAEHRAIHIPAIAAHQHEEQTQSITLALVTSALHVAILKGDCKLYRYQPFVLIHRVSNKPRFLCCARPLLILLTGGCCTNPMKLKMSLWCARVRAPVEASHWGSDS